MHPRVCGLPEAHSGVGGDPRGERLCCKPPCKLLEKQGARVAHELLGAASPLSTNIAEVGCGAGFYPAADFQSARAPTLSNKACGARDVPGRDRLPLVPTPLDRESSECRQECRHGTQECVRHQNPRPSDRAGPLWKASARGPIENRPQDKILPHNGLQHRSVSSSLPGGLWSVSLRHRGARAPLQLPCISNHLKLGLRRVSMPLA